MTRRFLLTLLLAAAALSAHSAESFLVGRTDLAGVPFGAGGLRAASSRTGHLAVWVDHRASHVGEIYATRLTSDGRPIDAEGLLLGTLPSYTSHVDIFVASCQGDYLVVWRVHGPPTMAARVRADGRVSVQTIDPFPDHGVAPRSLVSNGSSYLLYADGSRAEAVLLDLDGRPTTGPLKLGSETADVAGTRHGSWFVTTEEWDKTVRGGIVTPEMFPKLGRRRELRPLRRLVDHSEILLSGSDAAGVYTLRREGEGSKALYVYQRYNDLTRELEGWPLKIARTTEGHDLRAVTSGRSLYIAYSDRGLLREAARLYRVGSDGALREIQRPGGGVPLSQVVLFDGPAGVVMLWRDAGIGQIYAATVGGSAWIRGGTLLSRSRRAQVKPRIAQGSMGHLAVWTEVDARESLVARLLDGDGRPITEPVVITSTTFLQDVLVAFDGRRFLVVWQNTEWGVAGRFLTPDGTLSGEPFVILPGESVSPLTIASLIVDRGIYMLTVGDGLVRVSDAGDVLDDKPLSLRGYRTYLATCGDCEDSYFTALGVELTAANVRPQYSTYRHLAIGEYGGRFAIVGEGERLKGGREWGNVAPAFAKSGDGVFGVTYDARDGALQSLAGKLMPYQLVLHIIRMQAAPIGDEFVVAAGRYLARHAADGRLIGYEAITPDATDSNFVVDGTDSLVVLYQERGLGRGGAVSSIRATRVDIRGDR